MEECVGDWYRSTSVESTPQLPIVLPSESSTLFVVLALLDVMMVAIGALIFRILCLDMFLCNEEILKRHIPEDFE